MKHQAESLQQACLKRNVLSCPLNGSREGPRCSSTSSCFHRVGATTKEAQLFIEDLQGAPQSGSKEEHRVGGSGGPGR